MRCRGVSTQIRSLIWIFLWMLPFLFVHGCASGSTSTRGGTPSHVDFATTTLPDGQVGTSYSATLAATGGVPPYKRSISSGTLPDGLSLAATTGVLSGTPTKAVDSDSLAFQVLDSAKSMSGGTLALRIKAVPTSIAITTAGLRSGQVGAAYSATLVATGGARPYSWSLTAGPLPAGLSLNAATGAISGTPTVAVSSMPLTFKVTDASSPALTSKVSLALTITAAAPSDLNHDNFFGEWSGR